MGTIREDVLNHVVIPEPLRVDKYLVPFVFGVIFEHVEELVDSDGVHSELREEHLVSQAERVVVQNRLVAAHLVGVVEFAESFRAHLFVKILLSAKDFARYQACDYRHVGKDAVDSRVFLVVDNHLSFAVAMGGGIAFGD